MSATAVHEVKTATKVTAVPNDPAPLIELHGGRVEIARNVAYPSMALHDVVLDVAGVSVKFHGTTWLAELDKDLKNELASKVQPMLARWEKDFWSTAPAGIEAKRLKVRLAELIVKEQEAREQADALEKAAMRGDDPAATDKLAAARQILATFIDITAKIKMEEAKAAVAAERELLTYLRQNTSDALCGAEHAVNEHFRDVMRKLAPVIGDLAIICACRDFWANEYARQTRREIPGE